MAPSRPRNLDDSRSEASSSVTTHKDKAALALSAAPKGKRPTAAVNGTTKAHANGAAPAVDDHGISDPNLPRTDWTSMPTSVLRAYRLTHRLAVPSTFNHPHADITYATSAIASRAPSAVLARRKLHSQKQQQRKLRHTHANGGGDGGGKGRRSKEKAPDTASGKGGSRKDAGIVPSIEPPDQPSEQKDPPSSPAPSASSLHYVGPRATAAQLANEVRKHFNKQHSSEVDTVARFTYVAHHGDRSIHTEGAAGDGTGFWMGSHGRAIRKVDGPGGEVGFRLRFRP